MRDPNRIDDFCDKLKEVWKKYPDLRFGQILWKTFGGKDIFYMEDDEIINKIKESFSKNS